VSSKVRIRIIGDDANNAYAISILDAETGEPLNDVVSFVLTADVSEPFVTAVLHRYAKNEEGRFYADPDHIDAVASYDCDAEVAGVDIEAYAQEPE
jgi:hypothetical protein